MVQSRGVWKKDYQREVKPNSPVIWLWLPNSTDMSKEDKKRVEDEFLRAHGYSSVRDLPPGLKNKLRVAQREVNGTVTFSLKPYFYDVRFTEQMPGTEDTIGNSDTADIPWFDESGEETEKSVSLYNAICELIQEAGIKLSFADKIHGDARGVSMSGEIKVLNGTPKNQGSVSTLVHEFSHELLHQSYLNKSHKGSEWSNYFIGTSQGRAMVEQQAEVSAWIVMRFFGYDMPTSVNYAGIWGMDEKKVHVVFKAVASVASQIINKLQEKLYGGGDMANESVLKEVEGGGQRMVNITGYDLANMLGLSDLYMKSVKSDEAVQECFAFAKRLAKI